VTTNQAAGRRKGLFVSQGKSRLSDILRGLVELPRVRLCRRIVLWVFVSVVVIEAIIFIPSYQRRKNEILSELREISSARISVVVQKARLELSGGELDAELLDEVKLLQVHPDILGGYLYRSNGERIGTFGEQPKLSFSEVSKTGVNGLESQNGSRYDAAYTGLELPRDYALILRHDASSLRRELSGFTSRIAGLVLIISVFVTAAAWIALCPIVVTPIIKLRNDLINAGNAISEEEETPEFSSASGQRQDELGDVIAAFRHMYQQFFDATSERRKVEKSLQGTLSQVRVYSQALNDELEKGRGIQRNFLPAELPRKPGWDMAAFFRPARQVSGDFYDGFELPDGGVGLVIGDVCDKGVGAALFMALFRSLIRIFSGQTYLEGLCPTGSETSSNRRSSDGEIRIENPSPAGALEAVRLTNDYILQNHGKLGMFATLFFGVLDSATGLLTYINAGHPPPLVIDPSGEVREHLSPTGPAVGMMPGTTFSVQQTRLNPGDILLGYTDGVPEAGGNGGEFLGKERLLSMMKPTAPSALLLLDQIVESVTAHIGEADQSDDITLLAVRRQLGLTWM
jgi:sigma-B regulation protein RsbU (phosphoserine phosphatase)